MQTYYFKPIKENSKFYLVIYDISNDKRRYHVSRILEGFGKRIQMSAFECWLNEKQITNLREKLDKEINLSDGDDVRIYQLSDNKENNSQMAEELKCSLIIC